MRLYQHGADWARPLAKQRHGMDGLRSREIVAANGEIDPAAQRHRATSRNQMQRNIRMARLKIRKPRNEPAHQKGRLAGDHQRRRERLFSNIANGALNETKTFAHRSRQFSPGVGQIYATVAPFEQRHAEIVLDETNRPADCTMRQVQDVCGAAETFQSGRRLEAAKCSQWW